MIKAKPKKCKICKSEFTPHNSMIKHCSPECGYKIHTQTVDKKHKKEKKEYRLRVKTVSKWIEEAQTCVNSYVRLRDYHDPCISCGFVVTKNYLNGSGYHAGHFRSRGSAGHLRFNLHNIHKQCAECNIHKSGKVDDYRVRLIDKIGSAKVEALECNNDYRKIDREYCERVKAIFKEKTNRQKKRLGIQ